MSLTAVFLTATANTVVFNCCRSHCYCHYSCLYLLTVSLLLPLQLFLTAVAADAVAADAVAAYAVAAYAVAADAVAADAVAADAVAADAVAAAISKAVSP